MSDPVSRALGYTAEVQPPNGKPATEYVTDRWGQEKREALRAVVREAQAEAWDEGLAAGHGYDLSDRLDRKEFDELFRGNYPNPYREDDLDRREQAELERLIAAEEEEMDRRFNLPLHRTEAGYPSCSTCDGGGCPDCTDPA
jgi:hypothetical protein